MHVLVPVERRYTYDDTRHFAEIVAGALARAHPRLVTTEWTKAKRRGVLIDANQNGEGKTIASVYSVRPQAGAPVSTPLRWEEVDETLDPAAFTMDVVRRRVAEHGDLYAGVLTTQAAARAGAAEARLTGGSGRLQLLGGLAAVHEREDAGGHEPRGERDERALEQTTWR